MSYSAITQPSTYMDGYSFVPLRLSDTDASNVENYKYIINIVWNGLEVSASESYGYDGGIYTKLTFSTDHEYKIGDILLLEDASNSYSDYYIVLLTPSTDSVVIDLTLGAALTATTNTYNVIKYKVNPDPDFEAKVDLSNTLKDFVTQNFDDSNEIYAAPNTRFSYDLKMGYEGNAVYNFDDNYFVGGNIGFLATGLTAVTQVDFQVGDEIVIQQDLYEWTYTDNYFESGYVAFTGTTTMPFLSGQSITVAGQITNPYYNGVTTVLSADTYSLVTQKPWGSSSPVEGGSIFGVPVPEYNTSAVITDIIYSAGTGVIVVTDVPFVMNTPAIGGTIKHLDGRYITSLDDLSITGLNVYNSYVNQTDYSITEFDKYVVQNRIFSSNNISTILLGASTFGAAPHAYRIEKSSKSWLLAHVYATGDTYGVGYEWYDSNNNSLGTSEITGTSEVTDFYFPVGVDQVLANTNRVDSVSLSSIYDSIDSYAVYLTTSVSTIKTNLIKFEINDDCSRYELYHLMWKDARGSWISYPFKYLSRDTTDVDKKNYYQDEGTWSSNSFGFNTWGRGERTFFSRSRDKVRLNSGWISEYENALIKDLMQSAAVYIQTPDNELYGATIDNKSIEFGKNINDQVWQYNFDVVYSRNQIRL